MSVTIRALGPADVEPAVELSLRAWEPVFDSLRSALGTGLFERMHPDWRQDQRRAVEEVCADEQLTEAGMTMAMVETGGDPGHAPARATYEQADFTLLPIARYFKAL